MAGEQRCTDLAGDCECSEPLQATSYTESPQDEWTPNDASREPCTVNLAGIPIETNAIDPVVGSDSAVLNRLPVGHSVSRYLRFADGHTGIINIGHGGIDTGKARMSHRWYHYWSSDATLGPDEGCNAKFIETIPLQWQITCDSGSNMHMSDTTGKWDPDVGCCTSGPGGTWAEDYAQLKNNWHFVECVQTGVEGPDYRAIVYTRDITNDGDEVLFMDSDAAPICSGTNCRPQTPDQAISGLFINMFRNNQGGSCDGWAGVMYFMAASWDTDSGQRIGAAEEVEGDGEAGPTFTAGNRGGIRRGRVGLLR